MYITPEIFETAIAAPDGDSEMLHSHSHVHSMGGHVHVTYDIASSTLGKRRRAGCDDARMFLRRQHPEMVRTAGREKLIVTTDDRRCI